MTRDHQQVLLALLYATWGTVGMAATVMQMQKQFERPFHRAVNVLMCVGSFLSWVAALGLAFHKCVNWGE